MRTSVIINSYFLGWEINNKIGLLLNLHLDIQPLLKITWGKIKERRPERDGKNNPWIWDHNSAICAFISAGLFDYRAHYLSWDVFDREVFDREKLKVESFISPPHGYHTHMSTKWLGLHLFICYSSRLKNMSLNVTKKPSEPWLVWHSGLSAGLSLEGSLVQFPVRAHAWVEGQVPSRGRTRGNHTSMFLTLSFLLPSPL